MTNDPTQPLTQLVGTRIEQVYTAAGISEPSTRVWSGKVPSTRELPYSVFSVRLMPSVLAGTKDTEPVEVHLSVRHHDLDELRVRQTATAVQEDLTSRTNPPEPPGWQLIWHDLVFHHELHDVQETRPTIFGRVQEFVLHLEIP